MTSEPQKVRAGCFTAKIRCRVGKQTKRRGSCVVVHSVASPACVKYMSRQGEDLFSKVLCCPGLVLRLGASWRNRRRDVPSVVLHPAVLLDKGIDDFLHGQVGDQLVLGQGAPGDWVKMTHSL